MKKSLLSVILLTATALSHPIMGQTSDAPQKPSASPRIGILLLAHGGSEEKWDEDVRHVADQVDLSIPTEVAFGMAKRPAMQAAVDRLVQRKVTEIVAVPLFISSHSSLMDSNAWLLGLRSEQPKELKMFATMAASGAGHHKSHPGSHRGAQDKHAAPDAAQVAADMKPVESPVPIHMAAAFDHHAIVADILRNRAASISQDPAHEVVLLVAHGPVSDTENKLWLSDMKLLAEEMQQGTNYAAIRYLTLRDDADKPVRNAATKQLRREVKKITEEGNTALVVPLLVSYGGIEGGIRKRLSGLSWRMPTQGLLPDRRIVSWVIEEAKEPVAISVARPPSTFQ